MIKPVVDIISSYINSQSRNRIVFHRFELPGIVPVNLGWQLSEAIYDFKEIHKIAMKVTGDLDTILNNAIHHHGIFGSYISIDNIGILFEPELKIDFLRLLDAYSQNNVLFVKWEGEKESDCLYFLTKESGIKINIKNLSHIIV